MDQLYRRLLTFHIGCYPGDRAKNLIPKEPQPKPVITQEKLMAAYENGSITWKELQNRVAELHQSTDANGRKFNYVCPKCHAPMSHCPDPACAEEGVGHHLLEKDWEGCDEDIPYNTALMYYDGWMLDRKVMETVKKELDEAIQAVLAKHDCRFDGELVGTLVHKNDPATTTGHYIKVGEGIPEGWIGPRK